MYRTHQVVIGIDPQPDCLAYHVRGISYDKPPLMSNDVTFEWNKIVFVKKARFKTSQQWQTYIYEQVNTLLTNFKTRYALNIVLIVCEQQKGRVNSIIESTILTSCMNKNLPIKIMAPMTWRNLTDTPCTGSNYQNKKAVMDIVRPSLDLWLQDHQHQHQHQQTNTANDRLHDMCDAERISKAGELYFISKRTNESNNETSEELQLGD